MDVTYSIVKVYVTERNDVIKRHSDAITIRGTSAIEVIALLKRLRSEMKDMQEFFMDVRVYTCRNPSLAITVWHHSASLLRQDSDPRDGSFYLPLTQMICPYILPRENELLPFRVDSFS